MKKQKSTSYKGRILDNWRTTLLGIALLGFSFYTVATGKATLAELKNMAGWLISAGLLIRSKDTIIGVNNEES